MTSQLPIATNDRRLAAGEEPALGSHLVTPRLGFTHHGIYVGCGRVVHYGALVHGLHAGPVEDVALAQFTHGHTLWVRPGTARFNCEEVIRRARSRIGENSYHLLSNNCEHFCEWCLRGEHRSEQVERALVLPRRLAHGFTAAVVALRLTLRASAEAHLIPTKPRQFPDQSSGPLSYAAAISGSDVVST